MYSSIYMEWLSVTAQLVYSEKTRRENSAC